MKKIGLDFHVNENGCFIVTSHRLNKDGYAHFWHDGRDVRAHRLVYEGCFGEIPPGLVVRHKCDMPSCINPEHLELGTMKDNIGDAVIRKRNAHGSRNGKSKLDEEKVKRIKTMLKNQQKVVDIASQFEVKPSIVWRIKNNSTWKHVN